MSRWWLALLLGWVAIFALAGFQADRDRAEEAAFEAACPCKGVAFTDVATPFRSPGYLGPGLFAHRSARSNKARPAPRPAPPVLRALRIGAPKAAPGADNTLVANEVLLDADFASDVAQLAITFTVRPNVVPHPNAELFKDLGIDLEKDDPTSRTVTAFVEPHEVSTLGRPHCHSALTVVAGERVTAEVRALDRAWNASEPATLETIAHEGAAELQRCTRPPARLADDDRMSARTLGMWWAGVSLALGFVTLLLLTAKHSAIETARLLPLPVDAALRLATSIQREQLAIAAWSAISAVAIVVTSLPVAQMAWIMAAFGVIAMARWRTARKLETLAKGAGTTIEHKGPRVFAAHEGDVLRLDCSAADLRRARAIALPAAYVNRPKEA